MATPRRNICSSPAQWCIVYLNLYSRAQGPSSAKPLLSVCIKIGHTNKVGRHQESEFLCVWEEPRHYLRWFPCTRFISCGDILYKNKIINSESDFSLSDTPVKNVFRVLLQAVIYRRHRRVFKAIGKNHHNSNSPWLDTRPWTGGHDSGQRKWF